MTCAKPFSITVGEVTVLFLWGVPNLIVSGVGTADFTPNNTTGNLAVASATDDNGGVGDTSSADNRGLVTINTTAVLPCNLHIKATYTGPGIGVDLVSDWVVDLFNQTLGGPSLVSESGRALGNLNAEFDAPFNLPNTGGVNNVIAWDLDAIAGTFAGVPSTMLVEVTFSIV